MTTQVIEFVLTKPLPLWNTVMRLNRWKQGNPRSAFAWEVKVAIGVKNIPAQPFSHAVITVVRRSVGIPDPDGLSVKRLLDILQPSSLRHPCGLGIIKGDSPDLLAHTITAERVAHKHEQCTLVRIEGTI